MTLIAIYHFLVAIFPIIGACAILFIPISGALAGADRTGYYWSMFGLGLGFLCTVALGVIPLVTGFGLLAMKDWSRWLAIALAFILAIVTLPTIIFFPIFLLIGVAVVWYMLQQGVQEAFQAAGDSPELLAAVSPEPVVVPDEEDTENAEEEEA